MPPPPKAIIVGISGVSSSGKTTLARLLRDIIPNTCVLHEDDFYKPDADIPVKNGVADWDCLEAMNLPAFEAALSYIKDHGKSPPDLVSKEDQNLMEQCSVDDKTVDELKANAKRAAEARPNVPIFIIDGFLLFSQDMQAIRDLFDVKLLLRTDYTTAKTRREARKGYVTIEGFWEDPPGYVDDVVWPNYVKEHAFMFEDGNVEGELKNDVVRSLKIDAMPQDTQGDMTSCLMWAHGVLETAVSELGAR